MHATRVVPPLQACLQFLSELFLSKSMPVRDFSTTIYDTVIMKSLCSKTPFLLLTKSIEHLRYLKTIRNAGISFMRTDREVFKKL